MLLFLWVIDGYDSRNLLLNFGFIATKTEKLTRVSLHREPCASIYPPTPPHSFIFTLEIPSLVLPGSVWWTTSASAPPHPGSPHPKPPSSHNTPPAKTPSANPSEQLMAKVFLLQAGFRRRRNRVQTQSSETESHLSAPRSWTVVVCRVWERRPFLPYKSVQSHVPVLHKHTPTCILLFQLR